MPRYHNSFKRASWQRAGRCTATGSADGCATTPAQVISHKARCYTELNLVGANIKLKVFHDTFHGFDGSTARNSLPQGMTAKNCTIEVLLTDVQDGVLGEARYYKTGAAINVFGKLNNAFSACNSRGSTTVAANINARDQAARDVI